MDYQSQKAGVSIMKIRKAPGRTKAIKEGNFIFPRWIDDLGWLKVLPSGLFVYLLMVCMVATKDLEGDEMWNDIFDIASKQRRGKPERTKTKRLEKQYGRPVPLKSDARGNVEYLIAIGLVVREIRRGKEILDLPETPPIPTAFLLNAKGIAI